MDSVDMEPSQASNDYWAAQLGPACWGRCMMIGTYPLTTVPEIDPAGALAALTLLLGVLLCYVGRQRTASSKDHQEPTQQQCQRSRRAVAVDLRHGVSAA